MNQYGDKQSEARCREEFAEWRKNHPAVTFEDVWVAASLTHHAALKRRVDVLHNMLAEQRKNFGSDALWKEYYSEQFETLAELKEIL